MHGRFTVVQGGLADAQPRAVNSDAMRAAGWRVVLRQAGMIEAEETDAWRALCECMPHPDPYADPDFIVTAAQHLARPGEIVFALVHAIAKNGQNMLGGVVPLGLPHPIWGGSQIRLWHPPIAFRPVEPTSAPGVGSAVIEAVVAHLTRLRPRSSLRLDRIKAEGRLMSELCADRRLRVDAQPSPPPIPAGQFVEVVAREAPMRIERIVSPDGVREAVERFLVVDARRSRRPILADPGMATMVRVTTRLFARRGLALIEFGHRGTELVSGAIHLGKPDARILWRSVNAASVPLALPRTADVLVALSEEARASARTARFRVIASA